MLPCRTFHETDEAVGFMLYFDTLSLNTLVTDEVLLRLTALFGSCGIGELQATIFHYGSYLQV